MSVMATSNKRRFELNSTMKKKRKDDDSEYLHYSPPTKSRRLLLLLESEITMEMEEDIHSNVLPQKKKSSNEEERSLLLYHPSISTLLKSPTSLPFTIVLNNTHSIPRLKDYLLSRDTTKLEKLEEDEMTREKRSDVSKECLPDIPWVPNPTMTWKEIVPETSQILEAEDVK